MITLLRFRSKILPLIVVMLSVPVCVMAQPGFDPGVPDGAPVDGGLSMLVVAGVIYGVNKFNGKRKNADADETGSIEK